MKKQKGKVCVCGLCRLSRHKIILIILSIVILSIISLRRPEYAENVAQAFMLLLSGV